MTCAKGCHKAEQHYIIYHHDDTKEISWCKILSARKKTDFPQNRIRFSGAQRRKQASFININWSRPRNRTRPLRWIEDITHKITDILDTEIRDLRTHDDLKSSEENKNSRLNKLNVTSFRNKERRYSKSKVFHVEIKQTSWMQRLCCHFN